MNENELKTSATMTSINGIALMNAFKKRGLSHSEIAVSFGYSKSYFSSCARSGVMRTSLAELLWNEHNIPLDEYKAGEVPAAATNGTQGTEYDTIYRAVCDAINDCQQGIFAAMYGAMKKAIRDDKEGRL